MSKEDKATMTKARFQFESGRVARELFCNDDRNLDLLEKSLQVKITSRDNFFIVKGRTENIERVRRVFHELEKLQSRGSRIHQTEFQYVISEVTDNVEREPLSLDEKIQVPGRKHVITPKSEGQRNYIQAIREKTLVFGIGPAGTGKTYLAMAMGISALKSGQVRRIILTRPAVEAGESLGFLPGDLYDKILPYLRPLYDALYDMIEEDTLERYRDRGIIEVVPLAYMRGRTLNDSFIILDEAQNSTLEQMRMFLTRLGFGSKAVITGDITQIDLPSYRKSGLIQVQNVLKNIDDIQFTYFNEKDVVRHVLVSKIIKAYEQFDEQNKDHEKSPKKTQTDTKQTDQHNETQDE